MPIIPFGEYRPDISDYEAQTERDILNVIPRADGYGPFPSLAALSQSLGQPARGAFEAFKTDGTVVVFAGTATDLYILNNTTLAWTKVSLAGGPYSSVSAGELWQFVQFNNLVIAVQANVVPQVYDITTSSAFANLAGSPPQARYVSVIGPFVVLTGLLSTPNAAQWSGLNDVNGATSWTAGINSSDIQTFGDGGFCRGIAGGQTGGLLFQDTIIRRMIYLPGDPRVFQIAKIVEGLGLRAPYSLIRSGSTVFFYSLKGFMRIDPGGLPVPIGFQRVDATFFADLDPSDMSLFQGAADPRSQRVMWVYKSVNGVAGRFDKALIYDPVLDKFAPARFSGELLFNIGQPGVTLEGLDPVAPGALAVLGTANNGSGLIRVQVSSTANLMAPVSVKIPGLGTVSAVYLSLQNIGGTTEANGNWFAQVIDGTHFDLIWNVNTQATSAFVHAFTSGGTVGGQLDLMTQSLDNFPAASVMELAAFDASHALNFFRGPALEATLETSEQGTDGTRIKEKVGVRPVSDSPVVFASASRRENLQQAVTAGTESGLNPVTGICNMLLDTRYSRFKCRIPAGTSWSFINGVEPVNFNASGKR